MFSQTFPRRPSFFEVTTASSFPVEKTFCPRLLSGRCVPPARTPPKAVGGGQREAAAGSRRWREVRRQLTIHNSLFTIQHFSSTTPLTILAYSAPPVKGQNAAVRLQESGAGRTHAGQAPASATHECRAPSHLARGPLLQVRGPWKPSISRARQVGALLASSPQPPAPEALSSVS